MTPISRPRSEGPVWAASADSHFPNEIHDFIKALGDLAPPRGSSLRAELESLAKEPNSERRLEGIYFWARLQDSNGRPDLAAQAYSFLSQGNGQVANTAQDRLSELQGKGGFGSRFERQLRDFTLQAVDPINIVGMTVGSTAFSLARNAAFARFGGRLAAAGVGIAAEVPAFWLSTKGLRAWHRPGSESWDLQSGAREMISLALTLGVLRAGGGLARRGWERWHGFDPVTGSAQRWIAAAPATKILLPPIAQVGGLFLSLRLQEGLELRAPQSASARLLDSLALTFQAEVGGLLSRRLFPRLTAWTQSLEQQIQAGKPASAFLPAERVRLAPKPAPALVADLVRELNSQGVSVINLGMGANGFPVQAHIREAMAKAAMDPNHGYGPVPGEPGLIRAILRHEQGTGIEYGPENVIVSAGGKASIDFAMKALLNPGDSFLILGPAWPSYAPDGELAGAKPRILSGPAENNFKITAKELDRAIEKMEVKPKLLILTNPHNPTGAVYSRAELTALSEVVRRRNLFVLADEIYDRFVYSGQEYVPFASLPGMRERSFVMKGGSKIYAMPGDRVTYGVGPKEWIAAALALQVHATAGVARVSQAGLEAALNGPQEFIAEQAAEFQKRGEFLTAALNEMNLKTQAQQGSFYAFAEIKRLFGLRYGNETLRDDMDVVQFFLKEAGVAMLPGSGLHVPGYVRLSFGAADIPTLTKAAANMKAALDRLKR